MRNDKLLFMPSSPAAQGRLRRELVYRSRYTILLILNLGLS